MVAEKLGQKKGNIQKSSLREVYVWCETATQLFKSSPLSTAQKAKQVGIVMIPTYVICRMNAHLSKKTIKNEQNKTYFRIFIPS